MIEKKQLFKELALPLAQNVIPFGIWYLDLVHNKLEWDDKMFEIYELDPSSFTGTAEQFQSFIHPDDKSYVDAVMQYAASDHAVRQAGFRIITQSGKTKFIDGNIKAITDFEGKAIGFMGINKDVTERKIAEAGRYTSEENYRKLLKEFSKLSVVAEKTINAVIITNPEGEIEWVNQAFTKMTGYFLHEVKNKKPGALLQGPETDPLSVEFMSNSIKHKKSFELNVLNYRKNGEKYWVSVIANPYFNEVGELEGFISIQTETTEKKNIEQRIRAERDRAKMYLDVVGSIVIILDADGIVLLANKAAVKTLAAENENRIDGKNWFDHYLPKNIAFELKQRYLAAMESESELPEFDEHEITDLEGKIKLIEWHNVLLKDEKGNFNGCIISGKDITEQRILETELKESKDFYRSIFNGSMNAVLLADDANHYLDANPAAEQLLGYSREELIGMNVTALATDAKPELIDSLWKSFMDEHHQTGIIELQRKDGKKVIVEYRATANIKPGVHLSVITDVTDKIEYQNAIARQNEKLRDIAFKQSHEIRRPLSNILGLYEVLKLECRETNNEVMQAMFASVVELDNLIREIVLNTKTLEEEKL